MTSFMRKDSVRRTGPVEDSKNAACDRAARPSTELELLSTNEARPLQRDEYTSSASKELAELLGAGRKVYDWGHREISNYYRLTSGATSDSGG